MSLETFYLTKNDSLPSLQYTVARSGAGSTTPNLTYYTAYLKVRRQGGSTNKFTITVTSSGGSGGQITSPTAGVVRFDWSTAHWNSTGTFVGEISFENSGGKVETAPDRQNFSVVAEY